MTELDDAQRAIVDHGDGPARVVAGFGTGATTALTERARRLRRDGRNVLVTRPPDLASTVALDVIARHDRPRRLLSRSEQATRVARSLASEGEADWPSLHGELHHPAFATEVASTVLRYQASFLGREELLVHADAAGEVERWEELAAFTERYLAALDAAGEVDDAGALVGASLLLRDPAVLAAERALLDDIIVDDFQLATFATVRLLTQLAGADGNLVVAGNPDAAVGADEGASARHLDAFARRLGAAVDIALVGRWRRPAPAALRLVDDDSEGADVARSLAHDQAARVITRDGAADAIGREWRSVAVAGAAADQWPAPRPRHAWFDCSLFGGPDVPADADRDRSWFEEERARFLVAGTRATDHVIVVARAPVTPFLGELVALLAAT